MISQFKYPYIIIHNQVLEIYSSVGLVSFTCDIPKYHKISRITDLLRVSQEKLTGQTCDMPFSYMGCPNENSCNAAYPMSIIERPDRFAAAVPICAGGWFTGMDAAERGKEFARFPLWIFHGDADTVVPVDLSRKVVRALKDAGENPKYTEYPGVGHDSWTRAYRDPKLIEWIFDQSRRPN